MPGLFDYDSNNSGLLGNLNAGFQNFAGTGRGLIPAIASGLTGLATGQRTDPVGMYQQMAGMTYQALVAAGVPEPQARLGATNPEVQKAITAKMFPTYQFHAVDNTGISFDPTTGRQQAGVTAPRAQQSVSLGGNTAAPFNPSTGTYGQPITGPPVYSAHNVGDTGIVFNPQTGQWSSPVQGAKSGTLGAGEVPYSIPGSAITSSPLAPPVGAPAAPAVPPPAPGGPGPTAPGVTLPMGAPPTLAEKAAQEKTGQAMGEARAKLPIAKTHAEEALGLLSRIQNHPGRNIWSTGAFADLAQYQKGTNQFDFHTLVTQAGSGALLDAITYFRGTGALSDAEGKAGKEAITSMNAASTKKGFDDALNQYRRYVIKGYENQQKIARGEMEPNAPLNVPGPTQTAPVAQGRTPPAKAIDALKADPSLRGQFDAYYGPGSAAKVLGGG